ncbi:MAG: hypothetical protein KDK78_08150, partial [Chlamydiia bacterium]|nr:hypothetical protein [Chlamydiia bacterium]
MATSDGCKNTLTLTFPNKRGLIGSFLLALHELPDAPDLVSCTTTRPLLQFLYIFDLKVDESRLAEVQRLVSLINKSAPLPGLSIDLMTCEVYWRYG